MPATRPVNSPFICFGFGGDQVLDAELARDGRGDEAVGGGDDGAPARPHEVPRHQRAGPGGDDRQDPLAHELAVPGIELRARVARQRLNWKSRNAWMSSVPAWYCS